MFHRLIKLYVMTTRGGQGVELQEFFTSALNGATWASVTRCSLTGGIHTLFGSTGQNRNSYRTRNSVSVIYFHFQPSLVQVLITLLV